MLDLINFSWGSKVGDKRDESPAVGSGKTPVVGVGGHFHVSKTQVKVLRLPVGPIANLKGPYFQPSLSVCVSLTGTSTLQR